MVKTGWSICLVPGLVQTPDIYFIIHFSFHKAIQELIKISEGDMRKVRQEAVMTGNVFHLN